MFERFYRAEGQPVHGAGLGLAIVKEIIVHEADNSYGKRIQKIEIIFNFIFELDFPAIDQPITVVKGLNEKTA